MESSLVPSDSQSIGESSSFPSHTLNSIESKRDRKAKDKISVSRLGESEEYDQSLLKRRKKKLQSNGIMLSIPKKALTAYAIFVKQKRRELKDCQDFNSKSPDMMKKLGKIWSGLSKSDK